MHTAPDIEPIRIEALGNLRPMRLLERGHAQDMLDSHWEQAGAGRGSMVVVAGEAGAGKSSLVEAFVAEAVGDAVLWGTCDPLSTPRPLGPLHDLAPLLGDVTRTDSGEPRQPHEIFAAVFEHLGAHPSILVIDDLHWADQATIDLLRFLLRRIRSTSSLVVGTVRDDEVGVGHQLRSLLGDVARSPDATLTSLQPLSLDAVAALIDDRPLDAEWLHATTGGNAFFVVEMLDHVGDDLPGTVRDAILARTTGLDEAAWELLHLLACAPEAIPDHLLAPLRIGLPELRALDDAGLIRRRARGVTFHHDLCRTAIDGTIPPGGAVALHRRMLDALEATAQPDPAVLVHHAVGARDPERILVHAANAGRSATLSGAHHEAADFFTIALDHGVMTTPAEQAQLLELLADECYIIDRLPQAIATSERALELRQRANDIVGVSVNHRLLSVFHWYNADRENAERHADDAVAVLDDQSSSDDGGPLGHAIAMQAYLALQMNDLAGARALAANATKAAGDDDPKVQLRAAIIEATCDVLDSPTSRPDLLTLLAPAEHGLDEIYSSGFSNLAYVDVEQRRLNDATALLGKSIPLTIERDLPICRVWQIGSRGRLKLSQGDWDDALADSDAVLAAPSAPLARTWPHAVRGLIALRRGADATADLDDAWDLARHLAEPVRLLPVAAALVEQAWLTGNDDDRLDACRALLADAPKPGLEWARGELAVRSRRLDPGVTADDVAEPYRLELAGDHAAAAEMWGALGLPFEQALALLGTGRPDDRRAGLDALDRLGADGTAAWFRQHLRSNGVTSIPARRRDATVANAAGLTARQVEVLALLGEGLTNAEVGRRLYISPKTADHHVTAILTKLGVNTRGDAVLTAREQHLID
jgi:DNA-binding CsgD family transcriptional regulator/tetratricopeptide (TPR) repeat protein